MTSRVAPAVAQLTGHWEQILRPRLDGLSDAEYFWEPVTGCWSIREVEGVWVPDFTFPEPDPAPVTTIAWRLAHIIVGVLAVRSHSHFDGPPASYVTWSYAPTADEALTQLDAAYANWSTGIAALTDADLAKPVGPAEGPWADHPMETLVWHINREVIHHGAEIALLRDLHSHQG